MKGSPLHNFAFQSELFVDRTEQAKERCSSWQVDQICFGTLCVFCRANNSNVRVNELSIGPEQTIALVCIGMSAESPHGWGSALKISLLIGRGGEACRSGFWCWSFSSKLKWSALMRYGNCFFGVWYLPRNSRSLSCCLVRIAARWGSTIRTYMSLCIILWVASVACARQY